MKKGDLMLHRVKNQEYEAVKISRIYNNAPEIVDVIRWDIEKNCSYGDTFIARVYNLK